MKKNRQTDSKYQRFISAIHLKRMFLGWGWGGDDGAKGLGSG